MTDLSESQQIPAGVFLWVDVYWLVVDYSVEHAGGMSWQRTPRVRCVCVCVSVDGCQHQSLCATEGKEIICAKNTT